MEAARVGEGREETAVSSEDELLQTMQIIWHEICVTYDVIAPIPEMSILFEGAILSRPYDVAEQILANMLTEVIEHIDRFSPWYTKSSDAFGLTTKSRGAESRVEWCLTAVGYQKWWETIDRMSALIEENANLIRAMVLVDGLITAVPPADTRILAQCHCYPARYIRVRQSVITKTKIICDICDQPFSQVIG